MVYEAAHEIDKRFIDNKDAQEMARQCIVRELIEFGDITRAKKLERNFKFRNIYTNDIIYYNNRYAAIPNYTLESEIVIYQLEVLP